MILEVRIFVATVLLGFGGLALLQTPPSGDPFRGEGPGSLWQLERLPPNDLTTLKLRHALRTDRFSVGLFGNSRALQVGSADLELPDGTFFNYSVPGTSFRHSVVLLEALSAAGKAPRVALLSFDNAALQYFANPEWPDPPRRWSAALRDLWHGARDSTVSGRDLRRVTVRHIWTDWRFFTGLFNMARLKARFGFDPRGDAGGPPPYRTDGSHREPPQSTRRSIERLPAQKDAVLPGYLAFDLARLAALRVRGVEAIVYESPMAPGSYDNSPMIERTRAVLKKECRRLELDCVPAPELGHSDRPPYWQGSDHAPAGLLGPWLARLLQDRASRRR